MVGSTYIRVLSAFSLAYLALAFSPTSASAQITEPDGFGPIPKDARTQCDKANANPALTPNPNGTIGCTGSANAGDFNCCGNTLDNMSLAGLFKYYEADPTGTLIDPLTDAKTEPATFNPLCSIQGNMVMKGGGCYVDFGWYCVDDSKSYGNPPVIHPLVTAQQIYTYATTNTTFPTTWKNNDGAFLPKTGFSVAGTPLSNIAADPDFQACASKKIGFAVKGNSTALCDKATAACACTQNKYTERRLNQIHTASGEPYVTAVIYTSKKYPGRFYIAVEDLPTSATQFNAPTSKSWQADGDFNDFVYTVEGVVCQGGGQLCTVPGKTGLCATGVTSCVDSTSTAAPTCDPVFTSQPETCNAIDDDCDGTIDNGDGLCPAGQLCFKGTCVHPCSNTGEFACQTGQVCVGQYCIDAACASVTCNADQKCVGGTCVGGCSDVVCTAGQQCVAGKCVDLCDVRAKAGLAACPDNFVCQNGACVPNCTCLACPDPGSQECQSNTALPGFGRCVASGCSDGHCGDKLCVPGGTCIEPCNPNPCGANQTCSPATIYDPAKDQQHQYSCSNPDVSNAVGGAGSVGGGGGICLGDCNQAGNGSNNGNSLGGSGNGLSSPGSSSGSMGCGCRVASSKVGGWAAAGLLGLALAAARRRRR